VSRENAVALRDGLFFNVSVTAEPALLPLAVGFEPFFFATTFKAAFLFTDFLGAVRFGTGFFAGFDALPALFFELIDFFLLFFLAAIRAV
jgi:hypothetical protein